MLIQAIVWVLLWVPLGGTGEASEVTVGGVFSTQALCREAASEVPERGIEGQCIKREMWRAK